MRVLATITIDGTKETVIEGDSPFMGGASGDTLEEKGLGVWLDGWRSGDSRYHKGRVFIPWTSCLYVKTLE